LLLFSFLVFGFVSDFGIRISDFLPAMTSTCRKCRRVNPPEAAYCFNDGVPLDGEGRGAALSVESLPFAMPFTFPSGHMCRNFNELALGCHSQWAVARDLLREGHLERFLGGIGRVDLAMTAREAARHPDPDRGLDDLLGRFPGDALAPAKLLLRTEQIDLGLLAVGAARRFALTLENSGMRLLSGSVSVEETPWLSLGDGPNSGKKIFQFDDQTTITVFVVGKRLWAGRLPIEGRLVVDTNGGSATLVVRAEVPVKPFPDGVLQGATTPRRVAELAKAAPKAAAALFEAGRVAQWYQDNGWVYPVHGPLATGLAAVHQFEALGLTKPPRVTLGVSALHFQGKPGDMLMQTLRVETIENRPIYAHAQSDRSWIKIGRVAIEGRSASIPVSIPSVPNFPGEILTGQVTVTANGNQRFMVPLTLSVPGRKSTVPVLEAFEDGAGGEEVMDVLPIDEEDGPLDVLPIVEEEGALDVLQVVEEEEDDDEPRRTSRRRPRRDTKRK
jgi:hypothetical protein